MTPKNNKLSEEFLREQLDFSQKIQHIYLGRNKGQPLAYLDTYGCQQNYADSELIMGMLTDMGFAITLSEAQADIAVFNTCAIREHAEMRVLGNVGKLKQLKANRPDLVIVMCGCMAQQEHIKERMQKSYTYVDILFGTHALYHFPKLLHQFLTTKKRVYDTSGAEEGQLPEGLSVVRDRAVKANLPIMYGCNNFCTYCVVPYVRGRERSRDKSDIIKAFKEILAQGYCEVTLLGQNVNSYGSDKGYQYDFADLLDQLGEIPGEHLIRFMTSHPKDANEKLFQVMARHTTIAKQLHLPVQSGNNRVLAAMNRGYTRERYLELVALARQYMPSISFSSDIIVGFPGETQDEAADTLSLIKEVGFDQLFTFIYSKRQGTKAADMVDNLSPAEKQVGFDAIVKAQMEIALARNTEMIGTTHKVLVDGESFDSQYPLSTKLEGGRLVKARGPLHLIGGFATVLVQKASPHAMFGEIIE